MDWFDWSWILTEHGSIDLLWFWLIKQDIIDWSGLTDWSWIHYWERTDWFSWDWSTDNGMIDCSWIDWLSRERLFEKGLYDLSRNSWKIMDGLIQRVQLIEQRIDWMIKKLLTRYWLIDRAGIKLLITDHGLMDRVGRFLIPFSFSPNLWTIYQMCWFIELRLSHYRKRNILQL